MSILFVNMHIIHQVQLCIMYTYIYLAKELMSGKERYFGASGGTLLYAAGR